GGLSARLRGGGGLRASGGRWAPLGRPRPRRAGRVGRVRFTDEHEMFRATVREVVQKEIDPHADAWEAAGTFPAHELFPKLGELGLLGVEYDPAYGGGGADHVYTMILGEELGRSASLGVSMAIAVQTDMATDRKSTRLNSSHVKISYAVFCLKKKNLR